MYPNTTGIEIHGSDIALFMIAICAVPAAFGLINIARSWIRMLDVHAIHDQNIN